MSVNIAIIYYSSTGHNYRLAREVESGAKEVGAETRVRKVRELAPQEVIDNQPAWKKHLEETADVPDAQLADLEWADGFVFGSPSRFGTVASQIKQFIDTTSSLWLLGKLANKAAAGFTSAQNPHGGQEQTLLTMYTSFYHWGSIIVPPGYTDPLIFEAGGNPYGVSATAGESGQEISPATLKAARYLGKRVATVAKWLKQGRTAGV